MSTALDSGVYVLQENDELVTLMERLYDSEDLLQALLAKYPSILAGDQISPSAPRRWLLIKREAAVPDAEGAAGRWSLDHLFVDQDGIPTLVEVKRSTDTRVRREVVGQMLDYAANAMAYWSVDSVEAAFEQTCTKAGTNADDALARFLEPDGDPVAFWRQVKTNQQAGKLRLLFVADEIPRELRRIVEFLNAQMDPAEVLAVEIKQYAGGTLKTLVPRVIGQTAEAESRKGVGPRASRQWDEPSFFEELSRRVGQEEVQVARALYDWASSRTHRITFGRGAQMGSIFPIVDHQHWHVPFALWTNGAVELQFQHEAAKPPFSNVEKRKELLRRLNAIPGLSLPEDAYDRRPGVRLVELRAAEVRAAFLEVMAWFLEQVRADD